MALSTPLKVSTTLKRLLVLTSNSVTYVARVDEVYGVNLCNHVTHRKSRIRVSCGALKKGGSNQHRSNGETKRDLLRSQNALRGADADAERVRDLALSHPARCQFADL